MFKQKSLVAEENVLILHSWFNQHGIAWPKQNSQIQFQNEYDYGNEYENECEYEYKHENDYENEQ